MNLKKKKKEARTILKKTLTKILLATTSFSTSWTEAYLGALGATRPCAATKTPWARYAWPEALQPAARYPPTTATTAGLWMMLIRTSRCLQLERA